MPDPEHLRVVNGGWRSILEWRKRHSEPFDLSHAELTYADLSGCRLDGANLSGADLTGANLTEASLRAAKLSHALLQHADFSDSDLEGADLTGANLRGAALIHTNLAYADLSGCRVFGVAVWDVALTGSIQRDLLVEPFDDSLKVDQLEVAQFAYLLLQSDRLGPVLDSLASKVVLILGNFAPERKQILGAIQSELRKIGYVPMQFDFSVPTSLSYDETVTTLARLSRFIVADITDAKEVRAELTSIVPSLPSIPVCVVKQSGSEPWSTFGRNFRNRLSVLPIVEYESAPHLLQVLREQVVKPAEGLATDLRGRA